MIKNQCRWLVALAAGALTLLSGGRSADAAETKGVFCMDVTLSLTGVVFHLNLNYILNSIEFGSARGHSLFYGSSCYVVPATAGTPSTNDCAQQYVLPCTSLGSVISSANMPSSGSHP